MSGPPAGANGLNLAASDCHYLSRGLIDALAGGSTTGLEEHSTVALKRVWQAVRFSWWMTSLMHLARSESAQRSMAENYVGLPL